MHTTTTACPVCPECGGDGIVDVHHGPTDERWWGIDGEADCPECQGTGRDLCAWCGDVLPAEGFARTEDDDVVCGPRCVAEWNVHNGRAA